MNKSPSFAGIFYPEKAEELSNLLSSFKINSDIKYKSKAVILPHAGINFSGYAAMAGIQHLELSENIFIIAPSHNENFNNIIFPKFSYFETPLGSLEVNNRLIKEINKKFPSIINNQVFEKEHSIEVILPFIQNVFFPQVQSAADFVKELKKFGNKKTKIIPVLVGNCDYRLISDLISTYWENSSFIISSDLSHYYPQKEARQIDTYTATLIETGKLEFFQQGQACGLVGIMGLVDFANNNDCSMIRAMMYNSGDITKDTSKVVGYGAWFLYAGSKNEYLEKFYSKYILTAAKASIIATLNNEEFVPKDIPPALSQYGASFITLKINEKLRGCIGSVYPTKPLILDIIDNARNAGFYDNRFAPLTKEELNDIKISVSILSSIERIKFKDEKDLLSQIYPHGIIISDKGQRAVYLPIVWEQLPDREIFLNSLKEKAGFPANYFSRSFEAYKFNAIYIEE